MYVSRGCCGAVVSSMSPDIGLIAGTSVRSGCRRGTESKLAVEMDLAPGMLPDGGQDRPPKVPGAPGNERLHSAALTCSDFGI